MKNTTYYVSFEYWLKMYGTQRLKLAAAAHMKCDFDQQQSTELNLCCCTEHQTEGNVYSQNSLVPEQNKNNYIHVKSNITQKSSISAS